MIVTRRHLPRRTFLKGMGAVIALPMLDAMTPAFAARRARRASAPVRLAFTYVPNGITMADWTPAATGAAFEFTRIMKPLEPFRKDTLVLSGLGAPERRTRSATAPATTRAPAASYLTGVHPRKTAGADIQNGISVDQIAAQHLGDADAVRRRSSSAATTRARSATATPAIRARTRTASPGAARRRRCRRKPTRAWSSSGCSATSTRASRPKTRARRLRYRRSILDLVGERTTQLSADLGPSDRRKLDEYLIVDPRDRAPHRDGRAGHDRASRRRSTSRPASRC